MHGNYDKFTEEQIVPRPLPWHSEDCVPGRLSHRVRREVQIEERVVFFLPGREEELPGKNRIAFGEHSDICPKG